MFLDNERVIRFFFFFFLSIFIKLQKLYYEVYAEILISYGYTRLSFDCYFFRWPVFPACRGFCARTNTGSLPSCARSLLIENINGVIIADIEEFCSLRSRRAVNKNSKTTPPSREHIHTSARSRPPSRRYYSVRHRSGSALQGPRRDAAISRDPVIPRKIVRDDDDRDTMIDHWRCTENPNRFPRCGPAVL